MESVPDLAPWSSQRPALLRFCLRPFGSLTPLPLVCLHRLTFAFGPEHVQSLRDSLCLRTLFTAADCRSDCALTRKTRGVRQQEAAEKHSVPNLIPDLTLRLQCRRFSCARCGLGGAFTCDHAQIMCNSCAGHPCHQDYAARHIERGPGGGGGT